MPSTFSFAATGDSFITRRLPENDAASAELAKLIRQSHFRFTNLETTVRRDDEGFPSAQSGGTWSSTPPEALDDLKAYGFNIVNWATNHTLDYSYGGLESTQRYLDASGLVHAGAGRNLSEAGAVRYLETAAGRIALIAATSTFHESWIAGNARPEIAGRPGVNPLRYSTRYRVTPERMAELRSIAAATHVNAWHNLSVKEGFTPADPEGTFRFGNLLFVEGAPGEPEEKQTAPHPGDLARLLASIGEARRQADMVVVSIHAHEFKETAKDRPDDFLVAFARACIDGGAHAVVGHGPHIVRAVEVYRNRPIFYSLGNFIFQNETITKAPADAYDKAGLPTSANIADLFDKRSGNGTRGFAVNPKIWESVVATWEMEEGELKKITLHPVALGYRSSRSRIGWPQLTTDTAALEDIRRLSREFHTEICIENGLGIWRP